MAYATVSFNIATLQDATAIMNALCQPPAPMTLAAAKQAVINWVTAQVVQQQTQTAQLAALGTAIIPAPPVLS